MGILTAPQNTSLTQTPWAPTLEGGWSVWFDARSMSRTIFEDNIPPGIGVLFDRISCNNINNETTSGQPTWSSNGVGNLPSYHFDGINDQLAGEDPSPYPSSGETSVCTILADFQPGGSTATAHCMFTWGNGTNRRNCLILLTSGEYYPRFQFTNASIFTSSELGSITAGPHIFSYMVNSNTSAAMRVDGNQVSTTVSAIVTGESAARMGFTTGGTSPWKGEVAQVLVSSNPGQVYLAEGYVAWEYDLTSLLPSSHPYKNVRPYF